MSIYQELPAGWTEATIPDLIGANGVFIDGDWVESKDQDPNGDIRLVQLADIGDCLFLNKSSRFMTRERAIALGCTLLKKGDVLVARMPDPLGRACTFPGDIKDAVTVVDVCIVRCSLPEHFDQCWLMYFINAQDFRERVHALQSGSTRKRISRGNLATLSLPIPPRKEQSRIVDKLEELLTGHDVGVTELKNAQKKLVQYRQSLLKSAFEGELSAEWRMKRPKQFTSAETGAQLLDQILIDRRKHWEEKQLVKFKKQGKVPPQGWQQKYPEPVMEDAASLPTLPENWVWANLGLCFYVGVGATPSRKEPDYWNGEIPWVSSGEVQFSRISSTREHISEKGLKNTSTQVNPKGSVLLGMIGEGKTRGQVSILDIDATNNQNCAAIWVSETPIIPEFVYYWLWSQYDATRRGSSGNNQPALNKSLVEKIAIPIPPLAEIEVITNLITSALTNISEQESAILNSLKQSEAQRKNILKSAFSGQLVPQDPKDEPASVLLERIHAEREGLAKQPKMRKAKVKKEISAVMKKLIEVLGEAGDWMPAQDAFRLCGVADVGATTDQIESLYAELRGLDKANLLRVEVVTDAQGRKQYDRLKLAEKV